MNKYLIDEDKLRILLQAKEELNALEAGGVDNWDWYCESLHEHPNWNDDNCEIDVEDQLKNFQKVEE